MRRLAALLLLALPLLAAEPVPPTLRLPHAAAPLGYALDLTVIPEQEAFQGQVDIDTRVKETTNVLWLNASGLTVQEATFTPAGGRALAAKVRQAGEDFLGLVFDRPVPPGRGRIHVRYTGTMSRKSTHGLFTESDNGHWYAYSQFESTSARQAFPCFDEPGYKVPWQLTLHVPKQDMAVSNTPVASERVAADGLKVVRFRPTRPLPSYLVALGVGPFEVVDAGKAGKHHTPLRILVPEGHQAEAAYAAATIPPLFSRLEAYFGIPYPYEKLDSLVIPKTVSFGAMENPGLITYAQTLLLARPEDQSIGFRRSCANTTAHEMAHQWFGDYVTMDWWNDLWLNEGFATWMAGKITGAWKPEWDGEVSRVSTRLRAMGSDSLLTSRMIRQPIASKGDIENAFDGITYQKGATVLSMFESYLGPTAFRAGVRRYLQKHAFGNATTPDFLGALAAQGDRQLPADFDTFLDQAGVPLITATLKPVPGGADLELAQRRFLPYGSKAPAAQVWRIPITLRYAVHGKRVQRRVLMTTASTHLQIPAAPADLDYLLLNQGMTGYFYTNYQGDLLSRLLAHDRDLTVAERLGVLSDVGGAVQAGEISRGEALALVPRYAKDPNPHIAMAAAGLAWGVKDHLVPEDLRPNYIRFIQACFGDRARSLGFQPKAGEDENTQMLRTTLLGLVGEEGGDAALRTQAKALALKWLDDPHALDPNLVGLALGLAARGGDAAFFQRLLDAAKASRDLRTTQRLLGALGTFGDPGLQRRALAEVLSTDFDPRLSVNILWAESGQAASRQLAYDFMKQNYDALLAKFPHEFGAYLPFLAAGFDDAGHRADAEAFFKGRIAGFPGAERNLAQALEGISLREAEKAAQQASVRAFLAKY